MKILIALFILLGLYTLSLNAKPKLFLLNNYQKDSNVSGWYMSEKLDGVRAYWNGKKLISRNGKVFNPPKAFTESFPSFKLDGELWSKRNDFSNISSIVNRHKSHDGWENLTYNIFEVPNSDGNLTQRLQVVQESKYLRVIKQIKVKSHEDVQRYLKVVENQNGEGLVVRDGTLDYYSGRTNSALKVKSYVDAECRVTAHNSGNGKYENILGSLSCKMKNSKIIKIGTGLNQQERINPPQIGAIITFKYYGLTSKGNPRFPVFMRIRD